MKQLLVMMFAFACVQQLYAQRKPIVWIYTDMSDKTIPGPNPAGTLNDPDDMSAMAGYLLMANNFDTRGIIVASTHRAGHATSADQGLWADSVYGSAYNYDLPHLLQYDASYPKQVKFVQSSIKTSAEKFDAAKDYSNLKPYTTIMPLLELLKKAKDTVNVLCWGSVTEPAILVSHCIATKQTRLLQKLRFIAHWTSSNFYQGTPENPETPANCREDAAACAYLKTQAKAGAIQYFELGAIGQHGIVSGAPKGKPYFDQYKTSRLGTLFAEGKFVQNCVDHSDAATYWTLLGGYGVSLADVAGNGSNPPETEKANEEKFKAGSKALHDELLRRSKLAAGQ